MHFTGTPATTYASAAGVRFMLKLVIESRHPTETKGSTITTKTTKRKVPTQADNPATSCKKKKKQREFLTEATRLGISSQLTSLK